MNVNPNYFPLLFAFAFFGYFTFAESRNAYIRTNRPFRLWNIFMYLAECSCAFTHLSRALSLIYLGPNRSRYICACHKLNASDVRPIWALVIFSKRVVNSTDKLGMVCHTKYFSLKYDSQIAHKA
jgi:hypothetical protein